jgi:hypothetical protein
MTELEAFETIARKIHLDGVECIQGGNPCSDTVSVLFYIENYLNDEGIPSPVVSALSDDLDVHNRECIDFLRSMGSDVHGY